MTALVPGSSRVQKSRREINLEATRAALIEEARNQFASSGYQGAELGRIAAAAGVTTGAIYHHFGSKLGLFQAVAESLEVEILHAAASDLTDPLAALRESFDRLIGVCAAPEIQRITFVEAPQVIGPQAWLEIELRYAYGAMRRNLMSLEAAGVIPPHPPELLARLLLALLRETSTAVAQAPDAAAEQRARSLANAVLDGIFGPPPPA
jgi:AcrR family transcriptional regulator